MPRNLSSINQRDETINQLTKEYQKNLLVNLEKKYKDILVLKFVERQNNLQINSSNVRETLESIKTKVILILYLLFCYLIFET